MIAILLCLVLAVGSTVAAASGVVEAGAAGGHAASHGVTVDTSCEEQGCEHDHQAEPCVPVMGHCASALLSPARDLVPSLALLESRMGFGSDATAATRTPETEIPPPRVLSLFA